MDAPTLSPDERWLATASGRLGGPHLLDVGPGPVAEPDRVWWHGHYARCVAFNPDGCHIAAGMGERRTDQCVVLRRISNQRSTG